MSTTIPNTEIYSRLNVASINVLFETRFPDRVLPQNERILGSVATLRTIEDEIGAPLDAFGVQELHIKGEHNNAETMLAASSAEVGHWQNHSRKKRGEHIGMFGQSFDSIESMPLADGKSIIVARMGKACIITLHLTRKGNQKRARELRALREYVSDEELVILLGDFNEEDHFFTSRGKLRDDGFESAFVIDRGYHPVTFPTPEYSKKLPLHEQLGIWALGGGLRIDDIYVKGLLVERTGIVTPEVPDHYAVYAQLRTPYGMTI